MAYIQEYWTDKEKRAEQARKHTKEMTEKYSRYIGTSILATKIYDTDYFENIEFENDKGYITELEIEVNYDLWFRILN